MNAYLCAQYCIPTFAFHGRIRKVRSVPTCLQDKAPLRVGGNRILEELIKEHLKFAQPTR